MIAADTIATILFAGHRRNTSNGSLAPITFRT